MIDRTASSRVHRVTSLDRSLLGGDQPGPTERVPQPASLAVLDAEQAERRPQLDQVIGAGCHADHAPARSQHPGELLGVAGREDAEDDIARRRRPPAVLPTRQPSPRPAADAPERLVGRPPPRRPVRARERPGDHRARRRRSDRCPCRRRGGRRPRWAGRPPRRRRWRRIDPTPGDRRGPRPWPRSRREPAAGRRSDSRTPAWRCRRSAAEYSAASASITAKPVAQRGQRSRSTAPASALIMVGSRSQGAGRAAVHGHHAAGDVGRRR